jgi:hypothetical protein
MPTIFQNRDWRVTETGIESRRRVPTYVVPAEQLLLDLHGHYYWPEHMAEKSWVSPDAFIEAYVAALESLRPQFDKDSLNKAIAQAAARKLPDITPQPARAPVRPAQARSRA